MSEQVLDKFIEAMMSVLNSAKDFTLVQAPDVLQQVIAWEIASGILTAGGGLLLLLFSFLMFCLAKKLDGKGYQYVGPVVVTGIGCLVSFAIGFIMASVGTTIAVKATVAPKVVLIEKLSKIVRGNK